MKKRVPIYAFTHLLKKISVPFITMCLLLVSNVGKAQVINETFEEAVFTTAGSTLSSSGSRVLNPTGTISTVSSTVTYYTAYGQSSATTTSINTIANLGTWLYSRASVGTSSNNTRLSRARSLNNFLGFNAGGYIVTPIITNGVATISFWVTAGGDIGIGLNTNMTAPAQPTHSSMNTASTATGTNTIYTLPTAYTYGSQIFSSSALSTNTGIGTTAIGAAMQLVNYTVSFTGPCRLGIFGMNASLSVDDIVITSNTTTPVSFGTITASQKNNAVTVQWNILTELNTAKYIVEKSSNGNSFNEAAQLNAGNTDKVYKWIDASPIAGNNFYRIKAVDHDGKTTYSSIVKVNNRSNVKPEMVVSPNPVKNGQLNVQLNDMEKGNYQLVVHDMGGRKILAASIIHDGGSSTQLVRLPAWVRKGTYNVQLINEYTRMNTNILVE